MQEIFAPARPILNDDPPKTKNYRKYGDAKKGDEESEPKKDNPEEQS